MSWEDILAEADRARLGDEAARQVNLTFQRAEAEAEAQLAVVRAVKPLNREGRKRVLTAVHYLLKAEENVPGILAHVAIGRPNPMGGGDGGDKS